MLSYNQIQILKRSGLDNTSIDNERLQEIAESREVNQLTDENLLDFLKIANALYRAGEPIISDQVYDSRFLSELKQRNPQHPFLHTVETETAFAGKTVELPEKMLSTDKTYTRDGIDKWLTRIKKASDEIQLDFNSLAFRATPKLDGFAAYDDGDRLYTRGDGRRGTDITRVFERGLSVGGGAPRGLGAGEIVVSQKYFSENLAEFFENARNFQASIIKEKELEQHALEAIHNKAAVFYPFSMLPDWKGTVVEILDDFEGIVLKVRTLVDYDVDGVIFEITDVALKQHMGSTRHHHRWQIAFKNNEETAKVKVLRVKPQTSRSGRVNPVAELESTRLSGALISRATAHHYGMVKELGIGKGALIELTRSGLVIPKIERVIRPAEPEIPDRCPSCSTDLVWDADYLYCPNTSQCPAQIENSIEHFFKTLGNIDGFGRKTIQKLHCHDVNSVKEIYQLSFDDLQNMGFGDKTSQNLLNQLERSKREAIEDWRFLGGFGIYRMGLGNCERLLQHYPLTQIFDLTIEEIAGIEGFAKKTAEAVVSCLHKIHANFTVLYDLNFNLIKTTLISDQNNDQNTSPIYGKLIVFTGTLKHGKREVIKKAAKALGAKVGNSITGKTDILVTGDNVGSTKINSAMGKGIKVITEDEYYAILSNDSL